MRWHCLVTKCDSNKESRDTGHLVCIEGEESFMYFFIRYCHVFLFGEISVPECSSAEYSSNIK